MSALRNAFGQRIRAHRKAQKISQEVLADRCGLHYTYIGAVERGECNLSFDNVVKIGKALGVGLSDMFVSSEPTETTREETAIVEQVMDLLANRSPEQIQLGLRAFRDALSWLGEEAPPKRRRRRSLKNNPTP